MTDLWCTRGYNSVLQDRLHLLFFFCSLLLTTYKKRLHLAMSPSPPGLAHGGKALTSSSLWAQLLQLPVLLLFPSVSSFIPKQRCRVTAGQKTRPVCFHRPEEPFSAPTYHCNPLWRATSPRVLIRGWAVGELVCVSLSFLPGHSFTPTQNCRVYVLFCVGLSVGLLDGSSLSWFKNIQYSVQQENVLFCFRTFEYKKVYI